MATFARSLASTFLVTIALANVVGAEPALARYEFAQPHMGVEFRLVLYAADAAAADKASEAAFARIRALDELLSDYKPDSELNKLSRSAPTEAGRTNEPIEVSRELWFVLDRAQQVARDSDGAFDVTVGPVVKLWRRARRQRELPSPDNLAAALRSVGYQHLRLDERRRTVQLLKPGMQLDLGGIAKGYAADEALAVLKKHGITRAMVAGSGDIALGDPPPGEKGWRIGVAALDPRKDELSRYLRVADCGVSTSGDANQHAVIGGKRYSHVVDPTTGLSLTHRSSVTVIARDGITADSLDTAIGVLGPEKGLELARRRRVEAIIVHSPDEKQPARIIETPGVRALREN